MSDGTPAAGAAAPRRGRRYLGLGLVGCLLAMVAAVGLLLGGLALLVALYARPFLEQRIVERARERGFAIVVGSFDLSLTQVVLHEVDVDLIGVRGVHAHVERLTVALEGLEPTAVDADGVAVNLEGSAPALALELAEWARAYPASTPEAYQGTLAASRVAVVWRDAPGAEPWLVLSGGHVVPNWHGGVLKFAAAQVAGVDLGPVGAAWNASATAVAFGFGAEDPAQAPLRVVVNQGATPSTAVFTLQPTLVHRLSDPLGVKLPIDEDVTLDGEARLTLPPAFERGKLEGSIELRLKGYVPPHPVELSGFVFGDTTTIKSRLAVSEDRQTVALEDTSLEAGRFVLAGRGQVLREATHAKVQLALRGDLSCSALAGAAAHTRLGQTLGKLVAPTAQQLVKGSVAVLVKVDADTRDLAHAKVLRTIGVGCGLKPIVIPGIGTLDLSNVRLEDLPDLRDLPELPDLPTSLPPLPSSLPPLFNPQGFALPGDASGRDDLAPPAASAGP